MHIGTTPTTSSCPSHERALQHASKHSSRPKSRPLLLSALTLLALPTLIHAAQLDCSHFRDGGVKWDFSKLSNNMTVHYQVPEENGVQNTTFEINLCKPLAHSKACPGGTRICAKRYFYPYKNSGSDPIDPQDEWPVAGIFPPGAGLGDLNPQVKRLKDSDAVDDDTKEGVRLTIGGGQRKTDKQKQRAVIEFICAPKKTGNEGPNTLSTETLLTSSSAADDDNNNGDNGDKTELPNLDKGQSLQLNSYKLQEDMMVLKMTWRTKFACEDQAGRDDGDGDDDGGSNGGWGFFTWFIIIFFLAVASYLIFGSWLNYNRYGARGWDLLPHGDTIRDIPYLLKDWLRGVLGTMQSQRGDRGYIRV